MDRSFPENLNIRARDSPKSISSTQAYPDIVKVTKEFDPVNSLTEIRKIPKINRTFVIIPLTIPAVGKTTLVQSLSGVFDCPVTVISSDEIRKAAIDEFMRNNPRATLERAFDLTVSHAKRRFFKALTDSFQTTASTSIVFLDKNHPTNSIKSLQDEIYRASSHSREIILVGLAPRCSQRLSTLDGSFPFSIHLLIQCLLRVKDREQHLTLDGSLEKKVGVVCMMFKLYKGIDFHTFLDQGFHHIIEVEFTDESDRLYPEELHRYLTTVLEQSTDRSHPNAHDVQALYRLLAEFCPLYGVVEPAKSFVAQLNNLFRAYSILQQESSLEETKQIEPRSHIPRQPKPRCTSKAPLYLAIDLQETLGHHLMGLVKSLLQNIIDSGLAGRKFETELSRLVSLKNTTSFTSGASLGGGWGFPASLHLTVVFLAGAYNQADKIYYENFQEGEEYVVELNNLVFVPSQLLCASARLIGRALSIKNAHPHVTLLLNGAKARMSNAFLDALPSSIYEVSRMTLLVEKKKYDVFIVPIEPGSAQYTGVSKAFYS